MTTARERLFGNEKEDTEQRSQFLKRFSFIVKEVSEMTLRDLQIFLRYEQALDATKKQDDVDGSTTPFGEIWDLFGQDWELYVMAWNMRKGNVISYITTHKDISFLEERPLIEESIVDISTMSREELEVFDQYIATTQLLEARVRQEGLGMREWANLGTAAEEPLQKRFGDRWFSAFLTYLNLKYGGNRDRSQRENTKKVGIEAIAEPVVEQTLKEIAEEIPWAEMKNNIILAEKKYERETGDHWTILELGSYLDFIALVQRYRPEMVKMLGLTDEKWKSMFSEWKSHQPRERYKQAPGWYGHDWSIAAKLRTLRPEDFANEISISEQEFQLAYKDILNSIGDPFRFLNTYAKVWRVVSPAQRERLPVITREYWEFIQESILFQTTNPVNEIFLSALAQEIKPQEYPHIQVPLKGWEDYVRYDLGGLRADLSLCGNYEDRAIQFPDDRRLDRLIYAIKGLSRLKIATERPTVDMALPVLPDALPSFNRYVARAESILKQLEGLSPEDLYVLDLQVHGKIYDEEDDVSVDVLRERFGKEWPVYLKMWLRKYPYSNYDNVKPRRMDLWQKLGISYESLEKKRLKRQRAEKKKEEEEQGKFMKEMLIDILRHLSGH